MTTFEELLKKPKTVSRIRQITPRHLSGDRMLRSMSMAIFKNPLLGKCNPYTLLGALQVCASLGLEINTPLGLAFLIPYKNKRTGVQDANLIIGYRGFIDLARRSGIVQSIHADVVYEDDAFEFEFGSNAHLMHRPSGSRDKPSWAYAHAGLKVGQAFDAIPYDRVLAIRDKSQGYRAALAAKTAGRPWEFDTNPWVAYEHEMAAKTLIRRLCKWLPLTQELETAAAIDVASEKGDVDFSSFVDMDGVPDIAARTESPGNAEGDKFDVVFSPPETDQAVDSAGVNLRR